MAFPTTHWSRLAKATLHGEPEARAALEGLCRAYWRPVNEFIRWRSVTRGDAEDLTQEFMLHIIEKSLFKRADRLRGQFRSFLLGALVRFLSDATDRRNATKRGGAAQHVSLERSELPPPSDDVSLSGPGAVLFDREWALTLLETALERLRTQYAEAGRAGDFASLKDFLPGGVADSSYATAAQRIGLSIPALKSEVHRLRGRLRQIIRTEVSRTVSAPHEVEMEIAHLGEVLMDKGSEFGPRSET